MTLAQKYFFYLKYVIYVTLILLKETLTELIDNNKKILERIDEATIKKFLKMLNDEQEDKYVKLVRALVLCNG